MVQHEHLWGTQCNCSSTQASGQQKKTRQKNKMIISNSAGPINQALDRGRSFARVFGGEIKWVQRVRSTGLVLSRSAIGLENDVRWRDLWSADEPV